MGQNNTNFYNGNPIGNMRPLSSHNNINMYGWQVCDISLCNSKMAKSQCYGSGYNVDYWNSLHTRQSLNPVFNSNPPALKPPPKPGLPNDE